MSATTDDIFLIWEDEEPGSEHWWLARAHEPEGKNRDLFIVEDDLTGYLVGVVRMAGSTNYKVIAAFSTEQSEDLTDALEDIKAMVLAWLSSGSRINLWQWRLARWTKLIWIHLPIALAGFIVGGLLGLLVAFFAVSSGLVGWPMLAAGLVIGAGAGPALKFLVDRKPEQAVTGPWVRFMVITISAVVGSALTAGGVFALFWGV